MKLLFTAVANFIARFRAGESGALGGAKSRSEPMPLPAGYSEESAFRDGADAVAGGIPEAA